MTYDENVFKEKANRKARIWIIFAVLLSANYGSDAARWIISCKLLSDFPDPVLAASDCR